MKYPLAPNGIFWTIQGEGQLLGEPMAFVRLAGCSVGCPECDTDYRVSRRMTESDIVEEVRKVVLPNFKAAWVWITGGEPTDHKIDTLILALRIAGFRVALATSGIREIGQPVQWLSVSPHTRKVKQTHGHELKVVPGLNGLTWEDVIELGALSFPYKWVQPIHYQTANGPEKDGEQTRLSLQACLDFVRTFPGWRLGIQAHKYWGVP